MPSIGLPELVVVFIVALVVFGPERLPEMARKAGRTIADLRRTAEELRGEFSQGFDAYDDEDADEPVDDLEGDGDEGEATAPVPLDPAERRRRERSLYTGEDVTVIPDAQNRRRSQQD